MSLVLLVIFFYLVSTTFHRKRVCKMPVLIDSSEIVIGWICCLCGEKLDETLGSTYEEGWLQEGVDWYCPDCRQLLS